MALTSFLAFLLWFYLFAASSALTYLSLRAWLAPAGKGRTAAGPWREGTWAHALRVAGFAGLTLAALIGAVSDPASRVWIFNPVSLTRMIGYALLLASTPERMRLRRVVAVSFALQGLGEILLTGRFGETLFGILTATAVMDVGIWLVWRRFTRILLRVRLTDKLALAFAAFSLFLMLLATISLVAVIRESLQETLGISNVAFAFQNLYQPLIVLFIAIVAASAIISFFLARNLAAPVSRMSTALRAIGRGDFDSRLRGIRSRDEMQDLAHEINLMSHRLKEADALRAEYVSFASHELRNPLTAIKGFVETLQIMEPPQGEGVTPEQRAEIYGIMQSECERLLRMTNELLDTSRVEAGRPVALHLQTFDVRRSADKVVGIMRTHTRIHQLFVTGPSKPVLLEADPDKIEQVLINLVSNAIKYSPEGGPIEVRVGDGGVLVEIIVRDRGIGMTPDQAHRVFDKFYRIGEGVGPSREKKPAGAATGAGIGLYLTRALVAAHGGSIRVESIPGEGSGFTVTLPKKQSAPPSTPVDGTRAISPAVPASRTPARIGRPD